MNQPGAHVAAAELPQLALDAQELAAGHEQGDLERLPLAHDARQEVGRPAIGAEPDVAVGQREEGIVAGGGVALIQAGKTAFEKLHLTGDEATGANIVRVAISAPLKQIAINAGLEGGVVVEKVRHLEVGFGLNAATGEYVDMIKSGIIDPAKVTRSALQNAASIAALFITTEAVITDKPENKPAAPMGGDGGGMDF